MIDSKLPEGAVTFLFTDIEGSTRLWQDDSSKMKESLEVHDTIIRASVVSNGGVVFKTAGDGFCASFTDPQSAVLSAVEAQRELGSANWKTNRPISVRMGLHTGTAHVRDSDYFGPTLNRTARVMAIGHGGQIVCSASTERLLEDDPPTGVTFQSLGTHHLKDLDRPEEIFQVNAEGLRDDFPPVRSESGGPTTSEAAEATFAKKQWAETVDILDRLEGERPLSGREHEMMGFSLWWLGEHDKVFRRLESAHQAYVREQENQRAAITAVELADMHKHNLSPDLANGWISRAKRLLEGDEDSVAMGYLLRWQAVHAFESDNDLEAALELSRRVGEIGRANLEGNLEVLSLQDQGRFLIAAGRFEDGMPLMDEAMTAAVAGDVNPLVVGRSYCNMLAVCDKTGDLRRASEWSEMAERWCRETETSPYPGICRVFKAELMWLNGKWSEAESEIRRASSELGLYTDVAGEAWYQYGLMRMRAGDVAGAEEAFQEALTNGREPVPGYAYVLARRGEVDEAVELVKRTLSESSASKLDRAGFLPALIELTLETGDLDTAKTALDELEEIAELTHSELFSARASRGRGLIALSVGDLAGAISHLRRAVKAFSDLNLPYEAAEARRDLARAYSRDKSESLAQMELKSALTAFERLGSIADIESTRRLIHT